MKGVLPFDPQDYDYGPATEVVRSILRDWAATDWFVPTAVTDLYAIALFLEHQRLAHAFDPELFVAAGELVATA